MEDRKTLEQLDEKNRVLRQRVAELEEEIAQLEKEVIARLIKGAQIDEVITRS